jgi:hypothetical protein
VCVCVCGGGNVGFGGKKNEICAVMIMENVASSVTDVCAVLDRIRYLNERHVLCGR